MKYYSIVFVNRGKKSSTVLRAENKEQAIELAKIKRVGRVITAKEVAPPLSMRLEEYIKGLTNSFRRKNRVTLDELVASFRQISMMLDVGISIHQVLDELIRFTQNIRLKAIFEDVLNGIDQGKSLSECFQPYKKEVGGLTISLIELGEQTGDMPKALNTLTTTLEEMQENIRRFKKALRYPLFTLFAMAVAFVILITLVVPKFKDIFSKIGADLPLPTTILLDIEYLLSNYGIYLLIAIVAILIVAIRYYRETSKFKMLVDTYSLKVYLIGKLIYLSNAYQYLSTLSELVKAGIAIEDALKSAASMINNSYYKSRFETVPEAINRGVSLTDAFRNIDAFENIPIQMIATGEKSGSLDNMLKAASNFYKVKYDSVIDNISASIEPLMTGFIAGLVLLLALGIFLPMWDMASAVRGR